MSIEKRLGQHLKSLIEVGKLEKENPIRRSWCGACKMKHPKKLFNFKDKSIGVDYFYLCRSSGNFVVVVKKGKDFLNFSPDEFIAEYNYLIGSAFTRFIMRCFSAFRNNCDVAITTMPPFVDIRYVVNASGEIKLGGVEETTDAILATFEKKDVLKIAEKIAQHVDMQVIPKN